MDIRLVTGDKRRYMPLLLLADEQEDVIDPYLDRGDLFALHDPEVRAVCVVTDEGEGVFEIQNLAVSPAFQRRGYGRAMVDFVRGHYRDRCRTLMVGTGDSPMTIPFYLSCGFREAFRVKDYMIQHYDHPIYEDGRQLRDRVVFVMEFE